MPCTSLNKLTSTTIFSPVGDMYQLGVLLFSRFSLFLSVVTIFSVGVAVIKKKFAVVIRLDFVGHTFKISQR